MYFWIDLKAHYLLLRHKSCRLMNVDLLEDLKHALKYVVDSLLVVVCLQ
jgi:hypothetical protein